MAKNRSKTSTLIKASRELAGLTQAQAGELCGYSRSAIEKFENGRRTPPERQIKPILDKLSAARKP